MIVERNDEEKEFYLAHRESTEGLPPGSILTEYYSKGFACNKEVLGIPENHRRRVITFDTDRLGRLGEHLDEYLIYTDDDLVRAVGEHFIDLFFLTLREHQHLKVWRYQGEPNKEILKNGYKYVWGPFGKRLAAYETETNVLLSEIPRLYGLSFPGSKWREQQRIFATVKTRRPTRQHIKTMKECAWDYVNSKNKPNIAMSYLQLFPLDVMEAALEEGSNPKILPNYLNYFSAFLGSNKRNLALVIPETIDDLIELGEEALNQ